MIYYAEADPLRLNLNNDSLADSHAIHATSMHVKPYTASLGELGDFGGSRFLGIYNFGSSRLNLHQNYTKTSQRDLVNRGPRNTVIMLANTNQWKTAKHTQTSHWMAC